MSRWSTLRRRLHHGDVDGRRREHYDYDTSDFGSLGEPLLSEYVDTHTHTQTQTHGDQYTPTLEELFDDPSRKVNLHWSLIFSQVLAQWAHWLANIVLGSRSLFRRLVAPASGSPLFIPALSSLQEERLRMLQSRLKVPFDGSQIEHQDALKKLWRLAFPNREIPPLKSELWKEMGWQGTDPSTDFRGGGFISLENLIYFAEKYPESFQCLLHKRDGQRAEWEYPFAVAGINISFMLAQMLDLQTGKPTSTAGVRFLELLANDEMAFDNLYCVAYQMMDVQWLAKRASYMEFNDVMKSTRAQLARELDPEDISSVKDVPTYILLRR